jgi:hypothetical protein
VVRGGKRLRIDFHQFEVVVEEALAEQSHWTSRKDLVGRTMERLRRRWWQQERLRW